MSAEQRSVVLSQQDADTILASFLTPSDPESEFLNSVAYGLYPRLKAKYPRISLAEIRIAAEEYRGVRVTTYVPVLLERVMHNSYRNPKTQLDIPSLQPPLSETLE